MLMVGIINWWYTDGLRGRIASVKNWLASSVDLFSISLLIRTLFNPFRQISAAMIPESAPVSVKIQSFGDRLFSRFFGFGLRLIMIIIGSIVIIMQSILALLYLFVWLIVPLSFVIGLVFTLAGYL